MPAATGSNRTGRGPAPVQPAAVAVVAVAVLVALLAAAAAAVAALVPVGAVLAVAVAALVAVAAVGHPIPGLQPMPPSPGSRPGCRPVGTRRGDRGAAPAARAPVPLSRIPRDLPCPSEAPRAGPERRRPFRPRWRPRSRRSARPTAGAAAAHPRPRPGSAPGPTRSSHRYWRVSAPLPRTLHRSAPPSWRLLPGFRTTSSEGERSRARCLAAHRTKGRRPEPPAGLLVPGSVPSDPASVRARAGSGADAPSGAAPGHC